MHKLAIAAIAALAFSIPAVSAMEIKGHPRTLAELEYCVKAYMNKKIKLPDGCKTIPHRVSDTIARR